MVTLVFVHWCYGNGDRCPDYLSEVNISEPRTGAPNRTAFMMPDLRCVHTGDALKLTSINGQAV